MPKRLSCLSLSGLLLALCGCATPYAADGLFGGFSETWLAPDLVRVTFVGNGLTGEQRAADLALLRAADLTVQKGYSHFGLISAASNTETTAHTTPTRTVTNGTVGVYGNTGYINSQTQTYGGDTVYVSKPAATNVVRLLKGNIEGNPSVFDAQFLCNSIGSKYGVSCGTR